MSRQYGYTSAPVALGGSGSSYIYGYIDANFKPNMEHDEARLFVRKAISHAIFRDGSSGGVVRTISITKNGLFRQTNEPFDFSDTSKDNNKSQKDQPIISNNI